jgi:hypothetical protein
MDGNRRAFLSTLGTASVILSSGCSTTSRNESQSGGNNEPSSLKEASQTNRKIVEKVNCDSFSTDAIVAIETTGTHAITESEELAEEIKTYISQTVGNGSTNVQIEEFGDDSTTYFILTTPSNEIHPRDIGEEFYKSEGYVAVREGQSIETVTDYFQNIENYLEDRALLEESTRRISWPEPTAPIEATATIDGVGQMTELVDEDLIEGRVPMEGGEKTVFSTADLSSITSPRNSNAGLTVFFSFRSTAQKTVYDRFRETNVITDSGNGKNDLHFYVSGNDVGAPKITADAIEGWNENGEIRALGAPIEMEDARRFYDRIPHLGDMTTDGEINAMFEIDICE